MFSRRSTFCQKVTVHKDQKSSYASKQDVLVLVTLRYNKEEIPREKMKNTTGIIEDLKRLNA